MAVLKRQFITDTIGYPIAIILPIEEYKLVEPILEQRSQAKSEAEKLKLMEQAPNDARFMTDLHEVMSDFAEVDAQWWEATK